MSFDVAVVVTELAERNL
jgi:hypothetical protein